METLKFVFKVILGMVFLLGGANHFRVPHFYTALMPDYIPAHLWMVYISGVTEVIAGVMLLVPQTSRWGAWFIFAHLLAFFPVHIWMIQHAGDRYAKVPLAFLWTRLALQFAALAWAYLYTRSQQ